MNQTLYDETIIKIEDLFFTYEDGTRALNGINLEIKKGRKIAFLGANGSGKSTFFLCLNGIHKPKSGKLYYKGSSYDYSRKGLLDLRGKVGIVFQDPDNQLFAASVYQEISFGILNLGVSEEQARQKVDLLIEEMKITDFKDKPTHVLSGGQKKQVSIADILIMNPEVIILDEPAASLDPKHTALVNELIDGLTNQGITVIISTHDVNFAYGWADEVVLFWEGKVLMKGEPEYVFSHLAVLEKTHLEQPAVLKMFKSLCKKGILKPNLPLPKTLLELQNYIEQIKNPIYFGRKKRMSDNKKAILVVSFGTSHDDTREKTIDVMEQEIGKTYPDYKIYRAWTSKMIIHKLMKERQVKINTVKEAMEEMIAAGIDELIIQPTHVINGIENDIMKEDALAYQEQFVSIQFGTPLLTCDQDNRQVIEGLMSEFKDLKEEEVLVFMGHGTTHYANAVYAALDYTFKDMGYHNVFVGTVEAYPNTETLLKLVKEYNPKKVILTPFMIVAGDHAKNDMASDDKESWKCQFEAAGYEVECIVKGLGEYKGIQKIFIEHIKNVIA